MVRSSSETIPFWLVHGAWHGAWCWQFVIDELEKKGHRAVAFDMPIDDPEATFDTYASIVAKPLSDLEPGVLVGHSRGCNVTPRVAGLVAVQKLIHVCPSFEPATINIKTKSLEGRAPTRNSEKFLEGIKETSDSITVFDKTLAREVFYHDCPEDRANWAISQLRPQRRSEDEPELTVWPELPAACIICTDDRVTNPEWSRYVALNWLNLSPIELPGGHSPFLSRPEKLADTLIQLARND